MSDIQVKTYTSGLSASTASIAALQTTTGTAAMTLTDAATAGTFHTTGLAAKVTLTSGGNISGVTITVTGTDIAGNALTEDITGPNNNTVTGTKFFNTVTSVAGDGSIGTNTSVGVAAGTTGGQAVVFAGRARLKGFHCTTGGTIGDIAFYNDSPISGTSLFSVKVATTTKDYIDPYIPDDGILFKDGVYLDLPAGTSASITAFYG
jgi:hypothetical protein